MIAGPAIAIAAGARVLRLRAETVVAFLAFAGRRRGPQKSASEMRNEEGSDARAGGPHARLARDARGPRRLVVGRGADAFGALRRLRSGRGGVEGVGAGPDTVATSRLLMARSTAGLSRVGSSSHHFKSCDMERRGGCTTVAGLEVEVRVVSFTLTLSPEPSAPSSRTIPGS